MDNTFKLDPDVDISETAFHGHVIRMSLPSLVKKLGKAHVEFMASKSQFEWFFSDPAGRPVVLYDYKSVSRSPDEWHVGTRHPALAAEFVRWFQSL